VERKSAEEKTEEKFGGGLMAGNSDRRLGGTRAAKIRQED
jgi:hypothetical protein